MPPTGIKREFAFPAPNRTENKQECDNPEINRTEISKNAAISIQSKQRQTRMLQFLIQTQRRETRTPKSRHKSNSDKQACSNSDTSQTETSKNAVIPDINRAETCKIVTIPIQTNRRQTSMPHTGQRQRKTAAGMPTAVLQSPDNSYFFANCNRISITWIALFDTFVPGPNTAMAPASNKNW